MTTRTLSIAVLLATLLAATPMTQGQLVYTPTAFNFQGRLYEGGLSANNLYDLQCRLFDAQTNGQQVGQVIPLPGLAVTNGYFNAVLDFGDVFTGAARWLEIQHRVSGAVGYVTLDRVLVRPTPYATFAFSAGTASVASSVQSGAITAAAFAPGAVASPAIADGSVCTADLCPDLLSNTFWRLLGNTGTDPAVNFLGTKDNQGLTLRVHDTIGFRLLPSLAGPPSIIGGDAANSLNILDAGHYGSVIAGGGSAPRPNQMSGGYFSFIGGGEGNFIRDQHNVVAGGYSNIIGLVFPAPKHNFIGGGKVNTIDSDFAVIAGGSANSVNAHLGAIGGGGFNLVAGESGAVAGGANNRAGAWAAVAGGYANHANGLYSSAGGGLNNVVSSQYAALAGGVSNTVNAFAAVLGGGRLNYIGSTNSFAAILGGTLNTNTAPQATILNGSGVLADKFGQVAFGSRFSANGDAQASFYHLRGTTTPNASSDLHLDGSGARLALTRHSAWSFRALVIGKAVGLAAAVAFEVRGMVVNMDGATTVFGVSTTPLGSYAGIAGFNAVAMADDANDALIIRVTSPVNATVRWSAQVETAEVNAF